MLNQIEKQFEGFMVAMYGKNTISEAQEKDMEKAFYGGMVVAHKMMTALDDDEDMALSQLDKFSSELTMKMEELTNVSKNKWSL